MSKFRDIFSRITLTHILSAVLILLAGLQVVFFLLGFIFPSLAAVKFGAGLYMIAAAAALFFIIKIATKKTEFERRDFLYMLLVLGAIALFFYLTKKYVPEMFSLSVPSQVHDTTVFQFTSP